MVINTTTEERANFMRGTDKQRRPRKDPTLSNTVYQKFTNTSEKENEGQAVIK